MTRQFLAAIALSLGLVSTAPTMAQQTLEESIDKDRGSIDYRARVDGFLKGALKKIVGGVQAKPGQLPWQVSLGVSWIASPADGHFCGGSIYNESWIITAAHCVDGSSPNDIIVTAGTTDLNKPAQRRNVAKILVKKGYVAPKQGDDIALLQLYEPLTLTDTDAAPIALIANGHELKEGDLLTTSGFGYEKEGGTVSAHLNVVEVPLVSNDTCSQQLSYGDDITNQMICAGRSGKDSCQGDSGGPLVFASSSKPELVGVVSWGEGCARPLKFGVYTKVSLEVDWVKACVSGGAACLVK
ncbi:serine protease [Rhizobium redzepovicii]|uniref:serine protease n=1 Tax=Rhizobium redzepovicii TaxID=2867518 RepID=UPI002871F84E|nr:serine protease [Rhizobium redzepovicii]MDR9781134.1 serine protease [Rhizobium redzepovicii]